MGEKCERLFLSGEQSYYPRNLPRHDPVLIQVVELLKAKAGGRLAELAVIEFNDNKYCIEEYDGLEKIYTPKSMPWTEVT